MSLEAAWNGDLRIGIATTRMDRPFWHGMSEEAHGYWLAGRRASTPSQGEDWAGGEAAEIQARRMSSPPGAILRHCAAALTGLGGARRRNKHQNFLLNCTARLNSPAAIAFACTVTVGPSGPAR